MLAPRDRSAKERENLAVHAISLAPAHDWSRVKTGGMVGKRGFDFDQSGAGAREIACTVKFSLSFALLTRGASMESCL